MYTTLLLIHVIAMIASIGLITASVIVGIFGKRIAARIATISVGATAVGGLTGMALLLSAPLSIKCAVLTAYLLGAVSVYVYGFAMGDADKARLIRRSVIVQDK